MRWSQSPTVLTSVATVHFVLNVKPVQSREGKHQLQTNASPKPKGGAFFRQESGEIFGEEQSGSEDAPLTAALHVRG